MIAGITPNRVYAKESYDNSSATTGGGGFALDDGTCTAICTAVYSTDEYDNLRKKLVPVLNKKAEWIREKATKARQIQSYLQFEYQSMQTFIIACTGLFYRRMAVSKSGWLARKGRWLKKGKL